MNPRHLDTPEAAAHHYGHGHHVTYLAGCECEPCEKSYRTVSANRRSFTPTSYYGYSEPDPDESEAAERARALDPFWPRQHGKRATYNAGCRCDQCREGHREYARERRRQTRSGVVGVAGTVLS